MTCLWDLKPQEEGIIVNLDSANFLTERLRNYGFNNGQSARYLYKTSMGGPRVYLLEDTVYSLSFEMAAQIPIQKVSQ